METTAKSLLKKISSKEQTPVETPESAESDTSQDLFNVAFADEDDFHDAFGMRSRFMSRVKAIQQPESQPDIMREIKAWRNYELEKYSEW